VKTLERRERSRLLRRVLAVLEGHLGRRRRRRRPDPLETLLHAVLSDNGSDLLAAKILTGLQEELVDWNELRVTTPRSIELLIHQLPDAADKALTVKRILQMLFQERHMLNLAHFRRFGQTRLWDELDVFGGLSPAVKARVLLKAFDFNVLPVTAEIERVAKRVGLIESYLTSDKVGGALDEILPPKRVFSFYHLVSEHAETVCVPRNCVCRDCVLVDICTRGRSTMEKDDGKDDRKGQAK